MVNENKHLTEDEKQVLYRDARTGGYYDGIWQTVGKCVFCDLNLKYIIHEENDIVITVSLYAYIDGQVMVVPRRHVRSVKELTSSEWETVRKFFYIAKKMIREIYDVKSMQIVQKDGVDSQSTVGHLHFLCIPFDGPDLCEWNYRTLKNTPLENAKLYKDHAEKIQKLSKRFAKKYA
jgi:diadenosine tetraphosphate (Ap4A) HIT family hydrolase